MEYLEGLLLHHRNSAALQLLFCSRLGNPQHHCWGSNEGHGTAPQELSEWWIRVEDAKDSLDNGARMTVFRNEDDGLGNRQMMN